MELRDLIVTPLLLIAIYIVAYIVRSRVTDQVTSRYFFPALTVRIVGALAVGFVYQFYYSGGDTFAYHSYGSRIIWEAFADDPAKGLSLLFSDGTYEASTYTYARKIWYYRDQQSFFVIRVAALFDLVTFSSYSGTAVLFAVVSFTGAWLLFRTFYTIYPDFHRWIALSCLFIPTVFFWGSGIFKDTLTLAALGISTFYLYRLLIEGKISWRYIFVICISFWIVYAIKKYILLSFLPAIILWVFSHYLVKVPSVMARMVMIPFVAAMVGVMGYFTIVKVAEDDPRYNLEKLAQTAQITAYDIRYMTGKDAGSGYSLGALDGSFGSMIRLAPQAINVSLFRPYLWEVRNPLMLLSALEGFAMLLFTIFVIIRSGMRFFRYTGKPDIIFCFTFSIVFAFAVGVSTYNFGTLSRYKIPMMPFYLLGIGLVYHYSNKERKLAEFEETEY